MRKTGSGTMPAGAGATTSRPKSSGNGANGAAAGNRALPEWERQSGQARPCWCFSSGTDLPSASRAICSVPWSVQMVTRLTPGAGCANAPASGMTIKPSNAEITSHDTTRANGRASDRLRRLAGAAAEQVRRKLMGPATNHDRVSSHVSIGRGGESMLV